MTDTTKYKNVCVPLDTYNLLKKQGTQLIDGINVSLSQVIQHHTFLAEQYLTGERHFDTDKIHMDMTMAKAKRRTACKEAKRKPNEYSGHKLHLVKKLPEIKYVGNAKTKDEIEARNRTIYHNRIASSPETMTLQQLGTMYGISRERVRQIQDQMGLELNPFSTDKSEVSIKKLTPRQEIKKSLKESPVWGKVEDFLYGTNNKDKQ